MEYYLPPVFPRMVSTPYSLDPGSLCRFFSHFRESGMGLTHIHIHNLYTYTHVSTYTHVPFAHQNIKRTENSHHLCAILVPQKLCLMMPMKGWVTAVQASGVRVARAGKGISGENSHGGRKKLHRASGGRSRASLNAGAIMGGEAGSTATWVKIPVRMYWWGSVQGWWAQWNRAVVRALFEVDLTDLLTGFGWQIMRRRSRKVSKIAAFKFLWDGQRCRARFTGKARGSQSLQGSRWLSRSIAGEAWTS